MDLESPPKVHPHCGRKGSLYFMLSRLIFFDGYYYVSVDLASAEDRILYVNLELEEKKLGCRKTTDKPQFLKGLPDAYGAQSHVFDGLLAQTGERSKYLCGVKLDVVMSNGETVCLSSEEIIRTYPEQYNSTIAQLLNIIHNKPEGGRILELGSRGPTSIGFRSRLPDNWKYVGVDIKEGENVTHVGDVHRLSGFIEAQSADIVYSSSVFEHLKAPWLVATECAKVLKRGGHIFVATHNTWPLHEAPWDFWRFTKYSWASIFNVRTGFNILDATFYELTKIVPVMMGENRCQIPSANGGWTGTACLAEKIAEPSVTWEGYIADTDTMYPG